MKVCMFVLNNCKRDARVLKEARTLTEAGHDVRIIAILDEHTKPYEEKDGFRIMRVVWDPLHRRALRGIGKAESFGAGLVLALPIWIYERSGRSIERSSPGGSGASKSVTREVEQLFSSTPAEDIPLFLRAYRRLRQGYLWVRGTLYGALLVIVRPVATPLSLIDYCRRSLRIVKDEPADVYHSHDLTTLPAGYVAKRRTGGKLVYDTHELFTQLHYIPRVERLMYRFLERRLIHRADAVIIPNEFAAEWLAKRYGIEMPVVVRNCPPLATKDDERRNNSLRRRLGLDDTVPVVIHVGIFSRSRGSEKLVLAAPLLDSAVIVFLGWGPVVEEDALRELVKQRHLEHRVLFAEPVAPDQVVAHISSAEVGVVLFRNFGLNHYYVTPNKLWECMNAGLPVVASDFPVLKSIVEGHRMGKTCNPEDPEDIAGAINYVLSDKPRYQEMKNNALAAAKTFNWENESVKLLEIYRRFDRRGDDETA